MSFQPTRHNSRKGWCAFEKKSNVKFLFFVTLIHTIATLLVYLPLKPIKGFEQNPSNMSSLQNPTAKTRYSDEELQEFKTIILEKLDTARVELRNLQEQLMNSGNGTEDTSNTYVTLEEGSATLEKEQLSAMAARQRKFIDHLENALIRIENKTYGICRSTGKLIAKERLRLVPHATLSIEAKNMGK